MTYAPLWEIEASEWLDDNRAPGFANDAVRAALERAYQRRRREAGCYAA